MATELAFGMESLITDAMPGASRSTAGAGRHGEQPE